ncbi:MAG TPA: CoA pyrophosphatase [Candidatus Binataceae bacterium]|nr:CoA pyrophosphatase [Candidatus Binataceae bacterium]
MSGAAGFDRHLKRLRAELAKTKPPPRDLLANNRKAAAVLIPILERAGELRVVYIRRSDHVESHRGQVAFPGGRVDPGDATLLDTALREAHEEVAIPPHAVEVLGAFPVANTLTSGIIVAPFAGVIAASTTMRPSPDEVAEIFEVPLSALRDPRFRGDYEWRRDGAAAGRGSKYPAIMYGGQTIWGLTLRITMDLLAMLEA